MANNIQLKMQVSSHAELFSKYIFLMSFFEYLFVVFVVLIVFAEPCLFGSMENLKLMFKNVQCDDNDQ